MEHPEVFTSLILSAHELGRLAAHDAGSTAPAAQWRVLSLLEQYGPRRVGELAVTARTTQPGMTRLIGMLARAGLVQRSKHPEDSRATLVAITDDGSRTLNRWLETARDALAPRFADLREDDWIVLVRAAEILARHTTDATTSDEH
ncbi:regulatory protein MarR [Microbacterium sp. HM58-2]|nr:regulatory protein MarR [Microbacterium sp. HM58-2]